jgi:hypothetical protein
MEIYLLIMLLAFITGFVSEIVRETRYREVSRPVRKGLIWAVVAFIIITILIK